MSSVSINLSMKEKHLHLAPLFTHPSAGYFMGDMVVCHTRGRSSVNCLLYGSSKISIQEEIFHKQQNPAVVGSVFMILCVSLTRMW